MNVLRLHVDVGFQNCHHDYAKYNGICLDRLGNDEGTLLSFIPILRKTAKGDGAFLPGCSSLPGHGYISLAKYQGRSLARSNTNEGDLLGFLLTSRIKAQGDGAFLPRCSNLSGYGCVPLAISKTAVFQLKQTRWS